MKLYHHPLSGHAHRARLFLSLVEAPHELIEVDLKAGGHKTPAFLAMNPFGQVPVLDDDGVIVSDSNAILVYVAKRLGRSDWLPEDPRAAAAVQRWLSVAAGELAYGPAAARLITVFGATFHPEEVIARAHTLLGRLEAHLDGRNWLAAARPRPGGERGPVGLPAGRGLPAPDRGPAGLRPLRPDPRGPHGRGVTGRPRAHPRPGADADGGREDG